MNILVVAAHPDDEILGVGGTVAKHALQGDKVTVLILAEGVTSRDGAQDTSHALAELKKTAQKANQVLGVKEVIFSGLADNRMDRYELLDIVKEVEKVVSSVKPEIIYTQFANDLNIDHRLTAEAVVTAARFQPGSVTKEILFFETQSSTHWEVPGKDPFVPQVYVDISTTLKKKMEALEVYAVEMRNWPHARSNRAVEHLAHWRGSLVGKEACEAFQVGKIVR